MEVINFSQLLPLIIQNDKCYQILMNDEERKKVFNYIADLRGIIQVDSHIFCEVTHKC